MGGVAGLIWGNGTQPHTPVASYRRKLRPGATRVDTATPACAIGKLAAIAARTLSARGCRNLRHYAVALIAREFSHDRISVRSTVFLFLWVFFL